MNAASCEFGTVVSAWVAAVSSSSARDGADAAGWSRWFWLACALWLFIRVWRGWGEGLPREVCAVLALVGGALGGWLLAPSAAALLQTSGLAAYPEPALRTIGGALAGLLIWFVIGTVGRVLFKTTGQQTFAPVRLVYGAGGALVGLVLGLVGVVLLVSGVRLLGTVAEAARNPPTTAATSQPNTPRLQRTADGLHGLKQSLENGPGGGLLELLDPVPADTYRQLGDIARIAADPRAQERLLDDPRVRRLADHPRIVALREDPALARALEQKDFARLLRDQRILALAQDPQIQAEIRAIDWSAALQHALRASSPEPR